MVIALTVATFVSTSVDNLFLLVGFLTSPGFRLRSVVVGYAGAVILVLCVGLAASYAADFAPNRLAGYLGVVPIAMGVTRLYKAVRHGSGWETGTQPLARGTLSVSLVMLANSGDSVAAFLAVFAETREPFTFLIVAVGVALSLAWCGLARWIIGHAPVRRFLELWGSYLLPALLILVGVYILADTRTDTFESTSGMDVRVVDQRSGLRRDSLGARPGIRWRNSVPVRLQQRVRELDDVGGEKSQEADDQQVVDGRQDRLAKGGSLLAEKADCSRCCNDIVNGDHVAGRGANRLQRHDQRSIDRELRCHA